MDSVQCEATLVGDAMSELNDADSVQEGNTPKSHLSKTEKKRKRYEQKIAHQKHQRKRVRLQQQLTPEDKPPKEYEGADDITTESLTSVLGDDESNTRITKKQRLKEIKARLHGAKVSGQRICIDLSLEGHMSQKESSRLAQQLCRLYGSNRASEKPAHIYFTGLSKSGHLYKECVRKNNGFDNYIVDMSEKSHLEVFKAEEIVYLTPDSQNVLKSVSKDKVYIIGGLVDESVSKNITLSRAEKAKITTAKLPIDEYMEKTSGTHSKILSVNQVFEILLKFVETGDWGQALTIGVPQRKGYRLKEQPS